MVGTYIERWGLVIEGVPEDTVGQGRPRLKYIKEIIKDVSGNKRNGANCILN